MSAETHNEHANDNKEDWWHFPRTDKFILGTLKMLWDFVSERTGGGHGGAPVHHPEPAHDTVHHPEPANDDHAPEPAHAENDNHAPAPAAAAGGAAHH